MKKSLTEKLERLRKNPHGCRDFILADAKDADMAWGMASPGEPHPPIHGKPFHTMDEFKEQIRELVVQEKIDIMLASVSVMDQLAHRDRLFAESPVTPAVRANDTSDVWCGRGMRYREKPSVPFSTCYLPEVQFGSLRRDGEGEPVVNLGLYSVTFNNDLDADHRTLNEFRRFRAEAESRGFQYFLEVFGPNVDCGLAPEEIPAFVNDHISRMLAAVPLSGRPLFLKIPFFGPRWMEELTAYDSSVIVGVLGGSSGTTLDAFLLLEEAKKRGARVALYGRKIKAAEHPLTFVSFLREIADENVTAREAVKAYHAALQKLKIPPRRKLEDDLEVTTTEMSYAR